MERPPLACTGFQCKELLQMHVGLCMLYPAQVAILKEARRG